MGNEIDNREGKEWLLGVLRRTPAPKPSEKGIGRVREFYRKDYGRELTEAEAAEVLGTSVRLLMAMWKAELERELAGGAPAREPHEA